MSNADMLFLFGMIVIAPKLTDKQAKFFGVIFTVAAVAMALQKGHA